MVFRLRQPLKVPKADLLRDAVALRLEPAARLAAQEKTLEAFDTWCRKLPPEARLPTCLFE